MKYIDIKLHVGHKLVVEKVEDWKSGYVVAVHIICNTCEETLTIIDNPKYKHNPDTGEYSLV